MDSAKREPGEVVALYLIFEFTTPRRIASDASDTWARAHVTDPDLRFAPHLGDTASQTQTITVMGGLTKERLKASVDRFFVLGAAYAKTHGAAYANAPRLHETRLRFDEARTLDRADMVSFRRAAASWGWSQAEVLPTASVSWMVPVRVEGATLWIRQVTKAMKPLDRTVEIVRFAPEIATEGYWQRAQAAGEEPPPLVYEKDGVHIPATRLSIDLNNGVSLGELRRRIAEFAKKG